MIMDIVNSIGMETSKDMTTEPNFGDCLEKCVFAKNVTKLSEESKSYIKYGLFSWIIGGISATFMGLLVLVIGIVINFGGNINNKLDQVNLSVNNLRVESVEKITRIETKQLIMDEKIKSIQEK